MADEPIKQIKTIRSGKGSGHWLHPPRKIRRRVRETAAVALMIFAIAFAMVGFAAVPLLISAMAAEIPNYVPGPGFDFCKTRGF